MLSKPSFISDLDFSLLKKRYKSSELEAIIKKIENDYPVQYAIGDVDFLKTNINVDERVLIPRFETELLVDKLSKYIDYYSFGEKEMIDLCTGSGCIAIALKTEFSNAKITAIDISEEALELAQQNALLNNVQVTFIKMDILKWIKVEKKFSVLVSNPPYVKLEEEVSSNTKYEPNIALYPGEDDIIFYKSILDRSKRIMEDRSIIAFEIGATQGKEIQEYARKIYPSAKIIIEKDFNGFDRFIFIFNNF